MLIGLDGFENPLLTSLKFLKYSCMPPIVKPIVKPSEPIVEPPPIVKPSKPIVWPPSEEPPLCKPQPLDYYLPGVIIEPSPPTYEEL